MAMQTPAPFARPSSIRVITLNCWGLRVISKHCKERLREIGHQLAIANPPYQIVALQECWAQDDYRTIHDLTKHVLPHAKFYCSGFFGGGLVILSAWPIEESSMYAYPLNGRPAAFYRGDWYVGKGVACARIRFGPARKDVVEVFCTHLHASYEAEAKDSYACHRTAQAWEIARLMRHAAERGHLVLGLGDFNMLPSSLAYRTIEAHSPVRDVWKTLKHSGIHNTAGYQTARTALECLSIDGATCDSTMNTWQWSKKRQRKLKKGKELPLDERSADTTAKRLDYIFFADATARDVRWQPSSVEVGMMMRHPELNVSLSDHFSVEATFTRSSLAESFDGGREAVLVTPLDTATYNEILAMTRKYMHRERRQRLWRLLHSEAAFAATAACLEGIWQSTWTWLAFLLALISTIGFCAGTIDFLIAALFNRQELNALEEFVWEIENTQKLALAGHFNRRFDDYEQDRV